MENVEAIYSLSPMQEGILYHVLAGPRSGVFHEQIHFRIAGRLNENVWLEAWRRVVARHEVLRAAFFWEGLDQPVQVIRSEVEIPYRLEDWRDTDGTGRQRRLEAFLEADRAEGFALDQAPLLRLSLFRLDDTQWRFVWSFQHLLTDGWSTPRILSEVWAFYTHITQDRTLQIEAAPRYGAYLEWLDNRDTAASETFWRNRLADFTTPTPLPGARHSQRESAVRRHELEVDLPPDLSQSLAAFARNRRLTVSSIFQAVWGLLLSRYADREDVCFGVTVSGRPPELPGVDGMVGLFINTIPLRLKVDEEATVGDYLTRVQRSFVEAMDHQVTPLSVIQRLAGTGAGRPLFESILVFENYPEPPDPSASLPGQESTLTGPPGAGTPSDGNRLVTSDVHYIEQSNFPLALLVVPGASMRWIFVTDAARIDPEITHNLARHLRNLVEHVVSDPGRLLKDVSLFDEQEFRELTRGPEAGNGALDTPSEPEPTLDVVTRIERIAHDHPQRIAVADASGARLTYAELLDAADQIAGRLFAQGLQPGDTVGLLARRSAGLLSGMIGILRAGGVYVPLDPSYPAHRLRHMLRDSRTGFIVADPELELPLADDATAPVPVNGADPEIGPLGVEEARFPVMVPLTIERNAATRPRLENIPPPVSLNAPAYIIYTSGSTGTPKGVRVSHRSLAGSTAARSTVYETPPGRFLLLSSFAFDSSVAGIFWALTTGGALFVAPERIEQDLEALAGLVRRERITHTLLLPTVYRALLFSPWAETIARFDGERISTGADRGDDDSHGVVTTIIVAGEACPTDLVRRHFEVLGHVALYNEYGPTEGTVWCAVHRVRAADADGSVPIGSAVPGYALYVVDRNLRPVPHGASGELLVGGDLLADGYVGDARLTGERFLEDRFRGHGRVYRTGDLVRRRPDGLLEFVSRLDGQVKIRGFRIEPDEIGRVLSEHPDVREAVVVVTHTGAETGPSSGTRSPGTRSEVARPPAEPPQERPATSTTQPTERLSTSTTQPTERLPTSTTQPTEGLSTSTAQPTERSSTSTTQPEENLTTGSPTAGTGRIALSAYAAVRSKVDTAILWDFLRSRLPEHMVPSSIVLLDALPRLPNGKIDTTSLPDPGHLTLHGEQTRVGPRNEPEAHLHRIWAEVLRTSDFGVTDDFYRIGGDSILSIHVISRAREAGFTFTPAEFFASRTIDRLAAYHQATTPDVPPAHETETETESVSGPVPLSPIQHWFFEEHPTDPHHWGQTLDLAWQTNPDGKDADPQHRGQTLDLARQINPEEKDAGPREEEPETSSGADRGRSSSTDPVGAIRSALNALLLRHDALRLRFDRADDGEWQAAIAPSGLEAPLDVLEWPEPDFQRSPGVDGNPRTRRQLPAGVDYDPPSGSGRRAPDGSALEPGGHAGLEDQIDDWVAAAHGGMRLDEPPLLRALLVTRHHRPKRLILAVHHLVIDAVSWSLLVEDLRRLLQSDLSAPGAGGGTSYATWTRALGSLATSAALDGESAYWLGQQDDGAFPVDTSYPESPREADIENRTIHLDPSTSESFLGDANRTYRTRPLDLFLAAFVQAWHATTRTGSFAASLEGHGRDVDPTGLHLGRTVGWLTAFYPLRLEMPSDRSLRSLIRDTKERLRAVPHGGVGFGVLRYLAPRKLWGNRKMPAVVINYLGRIDYAWDSRDGLAVRGFRMKGARSPRGQRGPLVEVNSWVEHGQLQVDIGVSTLHFTQESADRLVGHVEASLRRVISHCLQTEEAGYTPSDFPEVDLSQDDLDALLGTLD